MSWRDEDITPASLHTKNLRTKEKHRKFYTTRTRERKKKKRKNPSYGKLGQGNQHTCEWGTGQFYQNFLQGPQTTRTKLKTHLRYAYMNEKLEKNIKEKQSQTNTHRNKWEMATEPVTRNAHFQKLKLSFRWRLHFADTPCHGFVFQGGTNDGSDDQTSVWQFLLTPNFPPSSEKWQ